MIKKLKDPNIKNKIVSSSSFLSFDRFSLLDDFWDWGTLGFRNVGAMGLSPIIDVNWLWAISTIIFGEFPWWEESCASIEWTIGYWVLLVLQFWDVSIAECTNFSVNRKEMSNQTHPKINLNSHRQCHVDVVDYHWFITVSNPQTRQSSPKAPLLSCPYL
jgi:hypothetical protein